MKKLLIGGGILGVLAVVVLLGSLATGVFALGTTLPAPSQATLTPEEAGGVAVAANPGTTAVKVEQDDEDGVPVYEVELDNGLEVQVEANSGAILGTEQEGADQGAEDADSAQETVESQADEANEGADDMDDVQDGSQGEFENQDDDAREAPGVEDVPGQ